MHSLTGWFIRNPVAANLLMVLIFAFGLMTVYSIRIEGFPRIPPETIKISTSYPNATANQVDELVTRKIETALEGLDGVRAISSESQNGYSEVTVRRAGGKDLRDLLDKVRLRIDGVEGLPAGVTRPVIDASGFDIPALYVNLHGDADPVTLQKLSMRLKEALLSEPELSRLQIWGLHKREMRIEIAPATLERYDLTIADIAQKIQSSSLDFQAGRLRTASGTIYLRADNKARFVADFADIPIVERASGTTIALGDIAEIKDSFIEGDYFFRFNGQVTSGMEVLVGARENLLTVSKVVHRVVDGFRQQLPSNVEVTIWGDSSGYIADRLALLRSNGIQGLVLVALILALFLNVRLAFWVAMGIPISVMGALAVAGSKWVDYSLNDVTTFGFILALGILVDDAVVVGESVFDERRMIKDRIRGTEAGVAKVAVATVFGVLTTIAAFFPLLVIDNQLAKVLAGFAGVVILALTFSLIESKLILPAHLAGLDFETRPKFMVARIWAAIQGGAQAGLDFVRDQLYRPVLKAAISHRYATLVLFAAVACLGIGLASLGKIKTVFFPDVPGQIISVAMEMDARAPFTLTQANIERIRTEGETLKREIQASNSLAAPPIRSIFVIVGSARSASIFAEMAPAIDRPGVPILDVVRQWRDRVGQVEGALSLNFAGSEEVAGGFQLRLQSKDADLLEIVSGELRAFLSSIAGVHNVRDGLATGQSQLEIRVKPEARTLGFDTETLARQIGYAYGGAEVQKSQRDGEEVRVLILHTGTTRDTIDDFLQSRLRSKTGEWIPIRSIADIAGNYIAGSVHRQNGKRVNVVEASVDRSMVAPEEISQAVFEQFWPDVRARYPSVEMQAGGELEEMGEVKGGLIRALVLAALLIYVLMAVPLKSYWQPVIILSIVPLGFVCAALGHLLMGLPLSLLSFFGMLALTGVIVNDCLVMITRHNQAREEGLNSDDSILEAGIGRFRAIFLTTATTVAGLLPLLMETSEQAQYLIPAAVSLAFGELFGTGLTLVLIPILLAISEDVRRLAGTVFLAPSRSMSS